jgi:hypothetical protein
MHHISYLFVRVPQPILQRCFHGIRMHQTRSHLMHHRSYLFTRVPSAEFPVVLSEENIRKACETVWNRLVNEGGQESFQVSHFFSLGKCSKALSSRNPGIGKFRDWALEIHTMVFDVGMDIQVHYKNICILMLQSLPLSPAELILLRHRSLLPPPRQHMSRAPAAFILIRDWAVILQPPLLLHRMPRGLAQILPTPLLLQHMSRAPSAIHLLTAHPLLPRSQLDSQSPSARPVMGRRIERTCGRVGVYLRRSTLCLRICML